MVDKEYLFKQYDQLDWQHQETTHINALVHDYIIQNIIAKKEGDEIKIFDIGFGIGSFFQMLQKNLGPHFGSLILEGCEPSEKNYKHFKSKHFESFSTEIKTCHETFLQTNTPTKFDFLTAIYVFPHFASDELGDVAKKIGSMLLVGGQFILVVANENYLLEKLSSHRDQIIDESTFEFNGKMYHEVLHHSKIPSIGTIIDYNRSEAFYLDLFHSNGFDLATKEDLDDNGFLCSIYVFAKK